MISLREAIANGRLRGGTPVVDPNQWDATALGSNLALSGSNRTVTKTGGSGFSSARSVGSCPATSDRYFKLALAGPTSSPYQLLGIATAGLSPSGYPGSDANGYGYYQDDGSIYRSASATAYGSSYTSGDTVLVAYKGSTGQLFFRKNGTWQNAGNPSTGAGGVAVVAAVYFAAVGIYNTGVSLAADFTTVDSDPLLASFTPWVP